MQQRRGFTLIELLIVVAIISILAAIAVPNFLHAQLRARITRVVEEQRNLATAMEAYRVDHADYPRPIGYAYGNELSMLSTPVGYIARVPVDFFKPWDVCPRDIDHDGRCAGANTVLSDPNNKFYDYIRFTASSNPVTYNANYWFVFSLGPDKDEERVYDPASFPLNTATINDLRINTFDVTNGLNSDGEIYRFGPSEPPGYTHQ